MGESPKGVSGARSKPGPHRTFVALFFAMLFGARQARAQHCQPPERPESAPFEATVRADAAHFESESSLGFYEGLAMRLSYRRPPFRVGVRLPYYRLLEPSGRESGFGDLDAKVEAALYRDEGLSVGASVSASFPTGSAEKRLGMGHVMGGPSVWALREIDDFFAGAEIGYGRALGADSHDDAAAHEPHHHHAKTTSAHAASIPNPMNREELWLGLRSSYAALPELELQAGFLVAVALSEGLDRATATAGVEFPLGKLRTALGIEVDLAGAIRREVSFVSVSVAP
jgi:hypothetical protein